MATSIMIGETIDNGKYVIESELGEGGLAVVYKVRHATLDTPFAVKILKVTLPSLQDRLIVEGQLQAQLQHPNVVKVTDVIKVDGFPALVMEFIDGIALDDYLNESTPSVQQAEELFLQVLDAVDEAHERGIIHRDLKPANVMMQRTRTKWIPKVCDFGLGKNLEKEGQTRTGQQMGTPAYMAPEQIRSTKDVDQRADIFSLGAILYELLTGHRAFQASNTLDLLNAVASQPHATPRLYVQDLEERYVQAIDGALTKNAEFRIPNCATLRRVIIGEEEWAVEKVSSPNGGDTLMSLGLDLMGGDSSTGTPLLPQNSLISERRVHQVTPDSAVPANYSLPPFEPQESNSSKIPLIVTAVILLVGLGWFFGQQASEVPENVLPSQQLSSTPKPNLSEKSETTETEKDNTVVSEATPKTEPAPAKAVAQRNNTSSTKSKDSAKPKSSSKNSESKTPSTKPKASKPKATKPKSKPKPVTPTPVVQEPATPETTEEAASEKTGKVKFSQKSGLTKGYLKGKSKTYKTTTGTFISVPVGKYQVKLECNVQGLKKTQVSGSIEVKEGKSKVLNCNCIFFTCS